MESDNGWPLLCRDGPGTCMMRANDERFEKQVAKILAGGPNFGALSAAGGLVSLWLWHGSSAQRSALGVLGVGTAGRFAVSRSEERGGGLSGEFRGIASGFCTGSAAHATALCAARDSVGCSRSHIFARRQTCSVGRGATGQNSAGAACGHARARSDSAPDRF